MKGLRFFNSEQNRWIWVTMYLLYISFIIILATAYYAEQEINTRANGTYNYVLTFDDNGKQEHYTVLLSNPNQIGILKVNYNSNFHHLDVESKNIRSLRIDCRSIAKEKSKEILNVDYENNENEYKQYFINKDRFTISVDTDHDINLTMEFIPYPSNVIVNDRTLEEGFDYTFNDGTITTLVPKEESEVAILFTDTAKKLTADFITGSKDYFHIPNSYINFDAGQSSGDIRDYIWDFGDDKYGIGKTIVHKFTSKGEYYVSLIVRDDVGLTSRITKIIYIYDEDNDNLPDNWELKYDIINPNNDQDNDGLVNIDEYTYNTEPFKSDTDDDGFSDGEEIRADSDPLDDSSYPDKKEIKGEEFPIWIVAIGVVIVVLILSIFIFITISHNKRKKAAERALKEDEEISKIRSKSKPQKRGGIKTKERQNIRTQIIRSQQLNIKSPPRHKPPRSKPSRSKPSKISDLQKSRPLQTQIKSQKKPPQNLIPPKSITKPILPPASSKSFQFERKEPLGMIDDDLHLPMQTKILYECPTCDAPVGEDDKYCPKCGEEFED